MFLLGSNLHEPVLLSFQNLSDNIDDRVRFRKLTNCILEFPTFNIQNFLLCVCSLPGSAYVFCLLLLIIFAGIPKWEK
jgi:hypothetical protein